MGEEYAGVLHMPEAFNTVYYDNLIHRRLSTVSY